MEEQRFPYHLAVDSSFSLEYDKAKLDNKIPRPSRSKPGPLLSDKELQNTFLEICRDQTKNYKEESPIFITDFQIKDLEHPLKRGDTKAKLKEICKQLEGQGPQEFSARFVDKDGEPLCFYLAKRWVSG